MMQSIRERIWFAYFCVQHKRSLAAQHRWQGRRLSELVRHSYRRVPLYKTLLDAQSLEPSSISGLADIVRLPITSKQTYIGRMPEECIDKERAPRASWYVTSGTAGTPLTFLMSDEACTPKYNDFASYRFVWWLGEPLSALARTKIARIKIRAPQTPLRLFVPVEDYLTSPEDALRRIAHFGPEIVSAYPSILLDIAARFRAMPALTRPSLRYILSFGEKLTSAARAKIEEAFLCEVYDRYGLEEIGVVGVECSEHDGFHINTESVIVEVLDEQGNPAVAGETGRIIATDLLNRNMPFIRYETGDSGHISEELCACGLRSPRLWIEGRYTMSVRMGGRLMHHLEFDGAMDGFMSTVLQYQVAKTSENSMLVRVVPGPAYNASVQHRIRERMAALLGHDVSVTVTEVAAIAPTPRGKSRILVDET